MPSKKQTLTTKPKTSIIDDVQIFCLHYLQSFDHVDAWKKTFPQKKLVRPAQSALTFLRRKAVQKRLRTLAGELIVDLEQDVRDIIAETKRIAAFNPMSIMSIDSSGRPVLDLTESQNDPEIMRMLKVRFSSTADKNGCINHLYDINHLDKMDALEKLYKYHKLYAAAGFEDKSRNIQVNVQFPLPGEHWRTGKPVPEDVVDYIDNGK